MKGTMIFVICVMGLILIGLDLYLTSSILKAINASNLLWFVFWSKMVLYVLFSLLTEIFKKVD